MKLTLRPRIVLFTVLPLVALAFVTLWVVNHAISSQVRSGIDDGLRRASATLESMLTSRAEYLAVAGEVIVQDPRFFSSLTLPGSNRDPEFRATVAGVAREFNSITKSDLFEVFDARGGLIASVGGDRTDEAARQSLVADALSERPRGAVLAAPGRSYQAVVTPVFAGGRLVGVLLLGARIGGDVAVELRDLTRSEVTFLEDAGVTASTLRDGEDRAALVAAFTRRTPGALRTEGAIVEIEGHAQRYLTLMRPLPGSDPAARRYYAVQRSHDAETAFLREVQAHLVELGLLAVLAALACGFIVSERIAAPLRRLVRGAEEIERGNYDYSIEVRSEDEIGYLATRFNEMREHQRAYVASLQEVARVKSEFINVASHELRTPVSIIRGFQELFAQGMLGALTPQQAQAVEAIGRSAATLTRIAEDATRVAQIEASRLALRVEEHAVETLVRRAVEGVRGEAKGRSVALVLALESDLGSARLDGERIVEALTHLLRNGVRFTPDGGTVTVRAAREAGRLVLEVEDTGIGIPRERQAALFGHAILVRDSKHHHSSAGLEFRSAGLGLGIPIVRGVVRMHGGTLQVTSEEGRGSVFRIVLPLEPAADREAA